MARKELTDAQLEERFFKKKPGRKALPPAEVVGPDFVGATPPDMAEQEAGARQAMALAVREQDGRVAGLARQLRYQGSTDPATLENSARETIRRIGAAIFELGGYLLLLKEACPHGQFLPALERLGIGVEASRRYMAVTKRFANSLSTRNLEAAGVTKLVELLPLDDEQLEELTELGQTGELSLDDVATMSVKQMRAAVRQLRQDNDFAGGQLDTERQRADAAEKRLAGKRPVVVPLDERIAPFQVEIAERQSLIERAIEAHHQATQALEAWWTEEVTQAPGYDPEAPAPLPRSVALVAMTLQDGLMRLAEMVGAAQHAFDDRFGADLAEARQYLMQAPGAPADGAADGTA